MKNDNKIKVQQTKTFSQNKSKQKNESFQYLELKNKIRNLATNNKSVRKHQRSATQTESFNVRKAPLNKLKFFSTQRKYQLIKTQNIQLQYKDQDGQKQFKQFSVCARSLRNIDANQCKSGQRISKFKYNKYYIKPEHRLKRVKTEASQQIQKEKSLTGKIKLKSRQKLKHQQQRDKIYNKFYDEYFVDQSQPFKLVKNKRFQVIQRLANDNIQILQNFSKEMISQRRRVPKIVQIFMQRKKQQKHQQQQQVKSLKTKQNK